MAPWVEFTSPEAIPAALEFCNLRILGTHIRGRCAGRRTCWSSAEEWAQHEGPDHFNEKATGRWLRIRIYLGSRTATSRLYWWDGKDLWNYSRDRKILKDVTVEVYVPRGYRHNGTP